MPARAKFFVFKPVAVLATIVATALTILLPLLQGVAWVNENAVWAVWVALLVLTIAAVLLHARLMAVQKTLDEASAALEAEKTAAEAARRLAADEARRATEASEKADAATAALASVPRPTGPTSLSESDRALAERLATYAFNDELLHTLEWFDPNSIPDNPLAMMDELSRLPSKRDPYDPVLQRHFNSLAETALLWRGKLSQLIWWNGDRYTTKLSSWVTPEAYKQHEAKVEEIEDHGDELRSQLLEFQRYYSSLNLPLPT